MDDLVIEVIREDKVALYVVGGCFFCGLNCPIDIDYANTLFAKSASLGFAPALNQVSQMYMNDNLNIYLGFVYKNLTISFGHAEFAQMYHNFRNEIIKNASENGRRILKEITRITTQKQITILNNQELVDNKQRLKNIVDEDFQYDNDYWLDVYNGENETLDLSQVKESDKIYLEKLYTIYYQSIESNTDNSDIEIQKIIEEMKSNLYLTSEIEILRKQAKGQAKKVYKFACKYTN